ncbi:hypothetical protein SAMN05421858_4377 [Haladaptatus litoreus]|uniref:Uncharacterized protein n=1 Tax=Haladaptatus litoreus TaxID=553468 RepID=A0A1N7ELP3_9EURY|nr:hypothetical protein [Haladaptatus litoreus]SIR88959.1 hypothetical protein SAMN05421858_4377 [Haladaptatus litoreus]
MVRRLTFSDITDQRTLTECADAPTESDDTPTTERALFDRAQAHAADVAAAHFLSLLVDTIEWDISMRAQRTAGTTNYDSECDLADVGRLRFAPPGAIQFTELLQFQSRRVAARSQ